MGYSSTSFQKVISSGVQSLANATLTNVRRENWWTASVQVHINGRMEAYEQHFYVHGRLKLQTFGKIGER